MRDVLIKSRVLGHSKTSVISEMKGNPSRIDLYDPEGDLILSLDITVSNSIKSGRIKKKKLRLRWELDKQKEDLKEKIISFIDIPEEETDLFKTESHKTELDLKIEPNLKKELEQKWDTNLLLIKKGEKGSKAVLEFHDQQGLINGPRIYVHNCRYGG